VAILKENKMSDFKSTGDTLKGDGSNDGYRHVTSEGASITVGPAKDQDAQGGTYISITDVDGDKRTIVVDKDGERVK
jgi:hypothetical protein